MKYSKNDLISYRLKRSLESIQEAKLLAAEGHWNATANRLYYAAFYAVNALLIQEDISARTHSGIKTSFYKNFIKSGILGLDFARIYDELFDKRQEGDYRDFMLFKKEDIMPMIGKTAAFVERITEMINN